MEMCKTKMLKEGDSLHRKVVAKAECTKGKVKKVRGILALVNFIKLNQGIVIANPEAVVSIWYLSIYHWHHSRWEDSFSKMVALHIHRPHRDQGRATMLEQIWETRQGDCAEAVGSGGETDGTTLSGRG